VKNIKLTTLLFTGMLAVISCKKNQDAPSSAITVNNLSGTYKLTAATITLNGETNDVLSTMEPCKVDNLQQLNKNLTYKVIDAGQQCDPHEDETGTWSLQGDTTLVLDGIPITINSFDGKHLVISTSGDDDSGTSFIVKETMTKQ